MTYCETAEALEQVGFECEPKTDDRAVKEFLKVFMTVAAQDLVARARMVAPEVTDFSEAIERKGHDGLSARDISEEGLAGIFHRTRSALLTMRVGLGIVGDVAHGDALKVARGTVEKSLGMARNLWDERAKSA
jgi:hypothetical protein